MPLLVLLIVALICLPIIVGYGVKILVNNLAAQGKTFAMVPEMTGLIVEKFRKMHRVFIAISSGPRFLEFRAYVDSRNRRLLGLPPREEDLKGTHYKDHPENLPWFINADELPPKGYKPIDPYYKKPEDMEQGYTLISRGMSLVFIGLWWPIYKVVEWYETRSEQEKFSAMTKEEQLKERAKQLKIPKHSVDLSENVYTFKKAPSGVADMPDFMPMLESADPIGVQSELAIYLRVHDVYKTIYNVDFPISAIKNLILGHWREVLSKLSFAKYIDKAVEETDLVSKQPADVNLGKLIPQILQEANIQLRLKLGIWQDFEKSEAEVKQLLGIPVACQIDTAKDYTDEEIKKMPWSDKDPQKELTDEEFDELKKKISEFKQDIIQLRVIVTDPKTGDVIGQYARRASLCPFLPERYPEEGKPVDIMYHSWGAWLRNVEVIDLEATEEAKKMLIKQLEALFNKRATIVGAQATEAQLALTGSGLAKQLKAQLEALTGDGSEVSLAQAEENLIQLTFYQTLKELPKEGRTFFLQLPNFASMFKKSDGEFGILKEAADILKKNPKLLESLKAMFEPAEQPGKEQS